MAISNWDEEIDQYYISFTRYKADNNPSLYVQELEIAVEGKTVEQCLEEMFGETLLPKIVIVKDGYTLGEDDGLKAISQWWSPALPKRNGQLP